MTYMGGGIVRLQNLGHVHFFFLTTLQERIVDIKLAEGPILMDNNWEHQAHNSWFDNGLNVAW